MCRETTCQTVTFLEHDERMCAPRARLGVRAIRWAIRQLRFEGATIAGLARQLVTTWNTVCPISSHACKPHLTTPPASQGFRCWELMSTYGTTRTNAAGAHVNSPASWTTRGKDHPTARLLGPGAGQVWHRVQELTGRARRRLPRGSANRDVGSLPGIQERHR